MGELHNCNLCGNRSSAIRFYKKPYTRVQCKNCGLVWSLEQPDQIALSTMYDERYFRGDTYLDYVKDQPIIELNARRRLKILHQYVQPPGKIVEIGCAAGFFLNICRQQGWTTFGVELSDYAARFAREQLNLDVFTGTLESTSFPARSAQLVALWDVIEHVHNPMTTLRKSVDLLDEGGILVISTGDIESLMSRLLQSHWRLITYDHLFYFSPHTIRRYLELLGLEVLSIRYSGRLVNPGLVVHMMFNNYFKASWGRVFKSSAIRLSRLIPNLPLNFWDVMTIYARRRHQTR